MFRYGFLSFLLLLCTFFPHSQDKKPPGLLLYQIAEKWYGKANASETTDSLALVSYQRVIDLLKKEKVVSDILVDSYIKCGILYMSANKNELALNNFQTAVAVWHKGIHLPDSLLFRPYLYAGSIQYSLNSLDSAVYYYKKAEDISNRYMVSEPERLYNKLGALYYETGDYRKCIRYFEKALSIVSEKKPLNVYFVVNYKNNIAIALLKMEAYQAALDIFKDLLKYHINEDQLYSNIATTCLQQGNQHEALKFFRLVKKNSAEKYNHLTMVFFKAQQYDSAAYYNKKALHFYYEEKNRNKNIDYGLALKYAGDLKCFRGDFSGATRYYQSALIQFAPSFDDTSVLLNPVIFRGLQNFSFLFDALTSKGNAFKKLDTDEPGQQHLQHALAAYTAALSLARHVARTYSSDEARLFLKNKVNAACAEAVTLAIALYNQVKDPAYLSAAFGYVENNKASVLQAGMQQLELSAIEGLPVSLVAEEKKYKALITKLTIQVAQTADSLLFKGLQKKIQESELLLSRVQEKLDENPAYHRLKFYTKEVSSDSIRKQLLNKDVAVLSYYYTESRLLCFYITGQQSGCSSIALTGDFFAAIKVLRKELESPGTSDRKFITETTEKLFQLLLAPVVEKIKNTKHLIILPYNEICYVPFELLKDGRSGSLVLNKYAITYNYSANFLFDDENGRPSGYNVLAMAPFAGEKRGSAVLPALPFSGEEITNLPGKAVTGENATRAQFMALSGLFPIIHLATHAMANDKDPLGCYIEFYGEKNVADSVHRLYEQEIYNLDMKAARLVILSACETGNGLLVNGEGIESLSRAFSYAGCKSVITSLWKADDKATAFIMKKLHVYLQKGYPKDEALQKAKLDYLNSAETDDLYKAPSYWAHLVLIGNQQPVVGARIHWYIPVSIGLLLLGGIVFLNNKRKRVHNIAPVLVS